MFCSALYVVDLKKFRKIAAGDRLRGQYQGLSQDPNSLSNLDQVRKCLSVAWCSPLYNTAHNIKIHFQISLICYGVIVQLQKGPVMKILPFVFKESL